AALGIGRRRGPLAQRHTRGRRSLGDIVLLWRREWRTDRRAQCCGCPQQPRRTPPLARCGGGDSQLLQTQCDLSEISQRALQFERLPLEGRRSFQVTVPARHSPQVTELRGHNTYAARLPGKRERFFVARRCTPQVAQVVDGL